MNGWRRRVGAMVAAVGLALLAGCGASAQDRARALGDALRSVDGVTSVETQTPATMFTQGVEARAKVETLDRATFERVARAYRTYLEDDEKGIFGSPPTAWVESPEGRVKIPTREDQAGIVGGFVERLDAADDIDHYDLGWSDRYDVKLTTGDPLAVARRYGTGTEALVPVGGRQMRLSAALPEDQQASADGVALVDISPHEEGAVDRLDALERAVETLTASGGSGSLSLSRDTVVASVDGLTLDGLVSRHGDLSEDVCDVVRLTVRSDDLSLEGCGDTAPVQELADQLDGVTVESFTGYTDPGRPPDITLASTQDLLAVAGRDLGDRPVSLGMGGTRSGSVRIAGPPDRVQALAPVAVAAHGPGRAVLAGTAAGTPSSSPDLDLEIRGALDDPQATFAAMREASWEGEIVIGVRSFGTDNVQVRWRSSATGTAQDARATRSDGDDLTAADQALVDAWDATAG